jgi:AraC family transcriptional regulator, regulatory protein of adaptative response / methylated-DNA-[protein]-cysteine methyltransferase
MDRADGARATLQDEQKSSDVGRRAIRSQDSEIETPVGVMIGSDGSITGYGGGLWRKQRLIELEIGVTAML